MYTHTNSMIMIIRIIQMIIGTRRSCDAVPRGGGSRRGTRAEPRGTRRGTNGVSTPGVTATFISFDSGTFWVLPLTYFYLPKSARPYLCPHSHKIHYFCSGPISVDPICPQPRHRAARSPSASARRQLRTATSCAAPRRRALKSYGVV